MRTRFLSIVSICLLSGFAEGGSISGKLTYAESQKGKIYLSALRTATGNKVLSLDGTGDTVKVESLTDLSGSEITVQYWFRGGSNQSAVRQQSGGWIVAGWNNLHILSHDGGVGGIAAGSVVDGAWHHLAMTWKQGGKFASYLDGVPLANRDAVNEPIPAHNAALYFGSFNGVAEYTSGMLDQISIFKRALSAEEIQANWFKRLTGKEAGLVGYWDFESGAAKDLSPNKYDGELLEDAKIVANDIPGLDARAAGVFDNLGDFSLANVPDGNGYVVTAFLDANGNGRHDAGEPIGQSANVNVSGATSGVNIQLLESPVITRQPSAARYSAGGTAKLSVASSGSPPLQYQWIKNGAPLANGGRVSGATTAELQISGLLTDDSGAYSVRVFNGAGETFSSSVELSVVASGATISGTINYKGAQSGKILLTAAQVFVNNKVLKLDGDADYAQTTLNDLSGPEITISYWFRGSSIQSAVRQQAAQGYVVAGWNGTHILSHSGGTSGIDAGKDVTDGSWHHLAMTFKQGAADGFRSYLDGKPLARRAAVDGPIPLIEHEVYFGSYQGTHEFMKGSIDEIAIWKRALTEAEIATGWNKPLSGKETGLLGYWNFDDGAGKDLSPGKHDATLNGDAQYATDVIPGFGGERLDVLLDAAGAYSVPNLKPGSNFQVTAFLDVNGNGKADTGEPSGKSALFDLTANKTGLDIAFSEAPRVLSQPKQLRYASGTDATLTIPMAGTEPITYQWLRDGAPVADGGKFSGAKTNSLKITGATDAEASNYALRATNAFGAVTSNNVEAFAVANARKISGTISYGGPGKVIVTTAQYAPGNKVLSLDGSNDSVEITDLTDLSGDEISILYWFRGPSNHSAVRQQSGAGYIVASWNNMHIFSNDNGTNGVQQGSPNDGQWHHVAVTWKVGTPNGFTTYLDGQIVAQRDSVTEPLPVIDHPLHFGAYQGTSEFAKGEMDEVAIFNRALSVKEVGQFAKAALKGNEAGLVGLWHLDDDSIKDASSKGRNGILKNGAKTVAVDVPRLGGGYYVDVLSAGAFSIENLAAGANYFVSAFADKNGNGKQDADEPTVSYSANPLNIDADKTGVVLDLGGSIPTALPALSIARTAAGVSLNWADATGFVLESSPTLTTGSWQAVQGATGNKLDVAAPTGARFYRFRKP